VSAGSRSFVAASPDYSIGPIDLHVAPLAKASLCNYGFALGRYADYFGLVRDLATVGKLLGAYRRVPPSKVRSLRCDTRSIMALVPTLLQATPALLSYSDSLSIRTRMNWDVVPPSGTEAVVVGPSTPITISFVSHGIDRSAVHSGM
jgi:hypothetical protein